MKYLLVLVFFLTTQLSFGQILTQDINLITPKEDYKHVKAIPIHSDINTSVFLVFIKTAVKKHVHQYHTEVVTVLEGKGTMYLGGKQFEIKKGDHIVIPPNTAHAVITTSKKPLKVLSIQAPEFLGDDRVIIEEPTKEENKEGTDNNGSKDDDIPEFEGGR